MKLAAKTDLEAPASFVYAVLADHAAWEREALRRGVEVERPADMPLSGVGAGWNLRFRFRGRQRKVRLRIDDMILEQHITVSFEGQSIEGNSTLEVLGLSPRRTRLRVVIEVKPKTIAARIFINTLRLAKGRVQARLEKRLEQLGTRIADRYSRSRGQPERA